MLYFNLDRKENGINLAETTEDFVHDKSGMSKKLPLHKGSHPKWDKKAESVINEIETKLKLKYGSLEEIPDEILQKATISIENKLKIELENLPSKIKLK